MRAKWVFDNAEAFALFVLKADQIRELIYQENRWRE